jgi:peptidoglycan-N-acetylglucosamine deacetylase
MKKVFLTIDDAPSRDFVKKVDFLKDNKIPAIFFCLGKLIKKNEDKLVYAVKEGFILGNHSFSHKDFSKISIKEVREEIKKTDEIIEKIYKKAKTKRNYKFFRFPYGNKGEKNKEAIQKILKGFGYKQPNFRGINYDYWKKFGLGKDLDTFWTFDIEEYNLGWKEIVKKINKKNPKTGGSLVDEKSKDILLMHDHKQTTELFFKVIEELRKRKIKFDNIF